MGRSKSRNYDRETDKLDKLKFENEKLKRQIKSLRKQLAKVDIDRYQSLKELLEEQEAEDSTLDVKSRHDDLKKKWECHSCKEDYLRLVVVPRLDGMFYFRRCPCGHKTKLKKFIDGVEGLKE